MRLLRIIFIAAFLGLLYFPLVNQRARFIAKTYEGIIPTAPEPNFRQLDKFPSLYENYFDQTFEMKPWMVGIDAKFKVNVFNLSPNPDKVVVGRDRWLFIAGEKMDAYRGVYPFSGEQLEIIKKHLHARALHAREISGARLYLVIIPLKQSVYPEYLPLHIKKVRPETRTEQFQNIFRNDTLVKVIEVKTDLQREKSSHLLYYKTDNHWNDMGGYVAYKKLISVLRNDYPQLKPVGLEKFILDTSQVAIGGEANMLNAGDWLHENRFDYLSGPTTKAKEAPKRGYKATEGFPYPWDFEMVRTTGDTTLPDALIFRDSFTDAMFPFLSENFNRTVFIFDAWEYKANYDIVDTEKPDIIIYLTIESDLDSYLTFE